jgi:enoyl-CoA hydratase/carnithine racemase
MAESQVETNESILLYSVQDNICTLTLNRPQRYNALSEDLLSALAKQLDSIAKDPAIHVVILAANGKAYCPGHDLKQMRANHDEKYYRELFSLCSSVMQRIVNLPQPVIAKVQGMATAAGCQLVASCDLAIASNDAKFAVSGITIGLFCSTPAVALSRNVSRKQAMEMLLTGEFVDAETAERYGLINRSVAPAKLDSEVDNLALLIAARPNDSIRMGKKLFYSQLEKNLDDAYDEAGDVMACNLLQPNTIEGVDAFLEKRRPDWKN